MSSSPTSSTRICPVCDAPNGPQSLFCAECGASLDTPAEGDTAAYEPLPVTDDSQQTTTFVPSRQAQELPPTSPHATPGSSPDNGALGTAWDAEPSASPATAPAWTQANDAILPIAQNRPTSRRGFFLGLLAFLLMLAVFLLWGWASILDQDTRNSISDLFGFIG